MVRKFDEQKDALDRMQGSMNNLAPLRELSLLRSSQLLAIRPERSGDVLPGRQIAAATRREGRKGKVKAKYRDPKTNETWSGRGRMASWLKSKQDAGEKIEKYLV